MVAQLFDRWIMFHLIEGDPLGSPESTVIAYGGIAPDIGRYAWQTPADGNSIEFTNFLLEAGVWQCSLDTVLTPDSGIFEAYVDGVLEGVFDLYNSVIQRRGEAAVSPIHDLSEFSFLISTTGFHTITFTMNGQNPSSSGFDFQVHSAWLHRTGDLPAITFTADFTVDPGVSSPGGAVPAGFDAKWNTTYEFTNGGIELIRPYNSLDQGSPRKISGLFSNSDVINPFDDQDGHFDMRLTFKAHPDFLIESEILSCFIFTDDDADRPTMMGVSIHANNPPGIGTLNNGRWHTHLGNPNPQQVMSNAGGQCQLANVSPQALIIADSTTLNTIGMSFFSGFGVTPRGEGAQGAKKGEFISYVNDQIIPEDDQSPGGLQNNPFEPVRSGLASPIEAGNRDGYRLVEVATRIAVLYGFQNENTPERLSTLIKLEFGELGSIYPQSL